MVLPAFLLSPLGRKIAAGALVFVVLAVVVWRIYASGKAAGEQSARGEEAEVWKERIEQERADATARDTQLRAEKDQAMAQATQMAALAKELGRVVDRASARIVDLEGRRRAEHARVDTLPDDQLFPLITGAIGFRDLSDPTPTYYPQESRYIAGAVTDWPLLKEKAAAMDEKIGALEQKVGALNGQVAALEQKAEVQEEQIQVRDNLLGTYAVAYAAAYNAIGLKRRSVKCLYLWKCERKKLSIPAPAELRP